MQGIEKKLQKSQNEQWSQQEWQQNHIIMNIMRLALDLCHHDGKKI